ncbi:sensor histidine kinase [Allostella vacuolata]|nr:sensor histidine kinase [Stella vacuolata]
MSVPVLRMSAAGDDDLVQIRQAARDIARAVGFDVHDQTRIATALSEVVRIALAHAGGGTVEFELLDRAKRASLSMAVSVGGPGIPGLAEIADGRAGDAGLGIASARRLMDRFEIHAGASGGSRVVLVKRLAGAAQIDAASFGHLLDGGTGGGRVRPAPEMDALLAELDAARAALRRKDDEIAALNLELESTNRGVVALYSELDDQAEQLRRASELKSRFLSNMSHEFRTPLNSMMAISRLLLDHVDGELSPEQERQVGYIRSSAQSLIELVNDLLDIAKVEAGKTDVRLEQFSVPDLIATLRGVLRPLLTNSQVNLVLDDASDIPMVLSDEGKVSQILRNLISNALKYTQAGTVRMTTTHDRIRDMVQFRVSDTGIGIAPDDLERIFHEFVQIEHPLQAHVRGTGLGLPLSRRLAGLLGGELEVHSEPGVGSTFSLTIPIRPAPTADPDPVREGRPILVIDDEDQARYVLRQCLASGPHPVIEAVDGEEGLERARTERPRLIFLDLRMPRMNGFETLEQLAGDPATAGIPVVIVTSSVLDAAEVQRLSHARAILSKADIDRDGALALVAQLAGDPGGPEIRP